MRRSILVLALMLLPHAALAQEAKALERADAAFKAQKWAEAYEAYDDARKSFTLAGPKKALVESRLKELEAKVSLLTIKTSEPDADIGVDGRALGRSPVTLRVVAGAHEITAEKEGFQPVKRTEDVRGGQRTNLEIALVRKVTSGRISVKEREGRAVHVLIDGKDVGVAPWEGEVEPGEHAIELRGAGISASSTATVARGQLAEVELSAKSEQGSVQITTSDGEGEIFLDGKKVGSGAFKGQLPLGRHTLEVKREGFATSTETIEVTAEASLVKTITLVRAVAKTDVRGEDLYTGLYGGFQLFGAFSPQMGSTFEQSCSLFGASTCSAPGPAGAGLGLSIGYTWDPIGFEIYGAAMADSAAPSSAFDGVVRPGSSPALTGPARTESWRVLRYGGQGALRVRATIDGKLFRFSLAVGPGFSFKSYLADRRTRTTDGTASDTFVPDQVQVASAAVSIEGAAHLRLSRKVALTAGLTVWIESSGNAVETNGDPTRVILTPQGPTPLRTPSYRLASGAQAFFGPFLGMTFGP